MALPIAACALAVLAVLFLFDSGVHSVHHVGEEATAQCPVAAVVSHLAGIALDPPCLDSPFLVAVPLADTGTCPKASLASRYTRFGRAPPLRFFL